MARVPIPARSGAFVNLKPGQRLKIVNTHGTQVVDTWALSALADDYHATTATSRSRYLSMCHTRTALGKLSVATNDILRDNIREPMLKLIEDTSGGVHDLLFAACDAHRYAQLGVDGYHESCADNLRKQLHEAVDLFGVVKEGGKEGFSLNWAIGYMDS